MIAATLFRRPRRRQIIELPPSISSRDARDDDAPSDPCVKADGGTPGMETAARAIVPVRYERIGDLHGR